MGAKKKTGNGHDSNTLEMVTLLREVMTGVSELSRQGAQTHAELAIFRAEARAQIGGLRTDLDAFRIETHDELLDLRAQVHGMGEKLDGMQDELRAQGGRIDRTNDRLEATILGLNEVSDDVTKLRGELRARALLGE